MTHNAFVDGYGGRIGIGTRGVSDGPEGGSAA